MAIARLQKFTITREPPESWDFVVHIEDDAGKQIRLAATFENLDEMSAVLDDALNAIVEAAEILEAHKASFGTDPAP